jgi:hypothetical protein
MMMFNRKETDKFSSNPKTTILIKTDDKNDNYITSVPAVKKMMMF